MHVAALHTTDKKNLHPHVDYNSRTYEKENGPKQRSTDNKKAYFFFVCCSVQTHSLSPRLSRRFCGKDIKPSYVCFQFYSAYFIMAFVCRSFFLHVFDTFLFFEATTIQRNTLYSVMPSLK